MTTEKLQQQQEINYNLSRVVSSNNNIKISTENNKKKAWYKFEKKNLFLK